MNPPFHNCKRARLAQKGRLAAFALIMLFSANSFANARQYANAIISESHVTSPSHSIDSDPSTFSELEAGTGIIIGIGNYSAHIEMQFPETVPANQTSYVRIEAQDNILSSLMGGHWGTYWQASLECH